MAKRRILVLFAQEWDRLALADPRLADRYAFVHAGFDLFRFPQNVRLLAFDARRFVERMVRLARRLGIAGVVSPHEQFGTLIAAEVARRLGLAGPDPRAVLRTQHKYYARVAMAAAIPQWTPRFGVFRFDERRPARLPLPFPVFVKPVKATFSVLARRIDSSDELARHLRLAPFERFVGERLIKPFDDLLAAYPEFTIDAHHLVAEELIEGVQVNVDGYVDRGTVRILGIVDELMYPGTMAFNRFEYPSSLPQAVQARLAAAAQQAIGAVGFDHGVFNVELCYDPGTDAIRVVEINPRVASQFLTLYESVDGIRLYQFALDLALGETPRCEPRPQPDRYAASFVFRKFDGRPVRPVPDRAQRARVAERHPDARLMLYLKHGAGLAREMKWLGSHRFAVLNLAGRDRADLYTRYRDIRDTLGFTRHAGPEPAPLWAPGTAAPEPSNLPAAADRG
ncbi:MAG: ATP-grasp domain-containing protein [Gammaproteobacteria bacterium]|jgi:biotin carboxylase|nr:ATP-grasp domain-containing protein [Gammaproteobacteria bacterium]